MHRRGMLGELAAIALALLSRTTALNLVGINGTELNPYIGKELQPGKEEASPIIQGACYSPFHLSVYPLYGGSAAGLDSAMDADFSIMKNYVKVVRTYYSSFYGYPVAPQAAKNGIQLYLGVFMTDESWYNDQVNAAVDAVKNYPNTIKAILVGNENIYPAGPYSASQVLTRVKALRARILSETGRTVSIGTVQRHNEWLSTSTRSDMLALANGCDIIGVNIYPFFDVAYKASDPLAMLNGAWNEMLTVFPSEKVRLTEIGYPTAGAPPSFAPYNIPSLANSISFYKAFLNWSPDSGGQEVFWFMFFDRRQDDNTMGIELEKYFGFYTANGAAKSSSFPNLAAAPTSAPTPSPTPAPTSAPVTSSQVCRVHKVFN